MIEKLSSNQIRTLKECGLILFSAMQAVIVATKPGITAKALDEIAETEIRRLGGQPSFKNYSEAGGKPFPAATCISINDQVVHGCPTKFKVVKDGDLVGIDIGCFYNGLFTDMAVTVGVGRISPIDRKLLVTTKKALTVGIKEARSGNRTGDIGAAIEKVVKMAGFNVVKDLVGHGVGSKIHQEPLIPNFGKRASGDLLFAGNPLAIEPMVNIGRSEVVVDKDGWTILTKDGSRSAHFEQTVVVTSREPIIITSFPKIN